MWLPAQGELQGKAPLPNLLEGRETRALVAGTLPKPENLVVMKDVAFVKGDAEPKSPLHAAWFLTVIATLGEFNDMDSVEVFRWQRDEFEVCG